MTDSIITLSKIEDKMNKDTLNSIEELHNFILKNPFKYTFKKTNLKKSSLDNIIFLPTREQLERNKNNVLSITVLKNRKKSSENFFIVKNITKLDDINNN